MSLKAYMGDSLFYSSVRKLLNDFAYSNINSHTLRDSLSSYSGIDLTDFFDYYVFDTITHHFAISEAVFGNNSAEIRIRSRSAVDENAVCGNARLPITFMSSDYRLCKLSGIPGYRISEGRKDIWHRMQNIYNCRTCYLIWYIYLVGAWICLLAFKSVNYQII